MTVSRRSFTVALVGADGAGKTSVARKLEGSSPLPVKYIYMGVNWEASNYLLPTTRFVRAIRRRRGASADTGGPPDRPTAPPPRPLPKRVLRSIRSALSLTNRMAEEWYRQLLAWRYVRRGFIVVFDRHFFSDYHAHDVVGRGHRTLGRRVHGFLLSRAYPKPDLVVFLDAPSELLLARKGEGTAEALERRRQDYFDLLRSVPSSVTVDASRPLDQVVDAVRGAIESFAASRAAAAVGS